MTLFTIRVTTGGESNEIPYSSVVDAINDRGLEAVMGVGAIASVWSGELCVIPDVTGWERLRGKLVANASTLLRGKV